MSDDEMIFNEEEDEKFKKQVELDFADLPVGYTGYGLPQPKPAVGNATTAKMLIEVSLAQPPKGCSKEYFVHLINATYTAFITTGEIPSVEEVIKYLPSSYLSQKAKVVKVMNTEEFRTGMRNKGIPMEGEGLLTTPQMYLMQILTNPTDKRDLRAKLKSAGITYATYRGWLKQPTFSAYLHKLSNGLLKDHEGDIIQTVVSKAVAGDLGAARYALELSGRHDPNRQQVADMQQVINVLLEIITDTVKDPELLAQIAGKIKIKMTSMPTTRQLLN